MSKLDTAFDPELFRAHAHAAVDALSEYLSQVERREGPVLPLGAPADVLASWAGGFDRAGDDGLVGELLHRIIAESNHFHHPRSVGHQVSAPLPLAALVDFVASFLNNGMAVYEAGPAATAIERRLITWLAGKAGMGNRADGVFTSGGSVGNLTALLAARQAKGKGDTWNAGESEQPCVSVSDQAHYCIARAVKIMGWGEAGIAVVPTDSRFRMRPDALADAQRKAESGGRRVLAVVASAGSTSTGAYDPLPPIADYCASKNLWFHVDGAHGACAMLSEKHAHLVEGLGRADSFVLDAHKMLLMPALITAVVFREGRRSYEAFSQRAEYLFHDAANAEPEEQWFDIGKRTLECTKRMMGVKLYVALRVFGEGIFAEHVDRTFALTERFAEHLEGTGEFELGTKPEANILCFRYSPKGSAADAAALDGLQRRIRQRIVDSGAFYLVQTQLHGRAYLRTTLINPLTTDSDVVALAEAVREAAKQG